MEPVSKKPRLTLAESSDSMTNIDLQKARAQNDRKLKSLFEGIFEKYGKDFSDIGDEIDLATGEIVVNKGHVLCMEHEEDTGESPESESEPETGEMEILENSCSTYDDPEQNAENTDMSPRNERIETDPDLLPNENGSPYRRKNQPASNPVGRNPHITKGPIDPIWQAPEIEADFWTPPKLDTSQEIGFTPLKERHNSPPTAGSIWAVRTPGRPRGSTSRKQNSSVSKKSPAESSTRKRKARARLDWSFAQVGRDDSDSDDPLQGDAPPSSNRSIKIRGPDSAVNTPKVTSKITKDEFNSVREDDMKAPQAGNIYYEKSINSTTPVPDTPEVQSSSPGTTGDTPTHRSYAICFESPTFVKPAEVIFTPSEVQRITISICESSTDICWEKIVEHLPGRTLDDLLDWAEHHPLLLTESIKTDGWSQDDLERLKEFADESGIWWRDFQVSFPHRSRKEIEIQMIRIWTESHLEEMAQQKQDDDECSIEQSPTKCDAYHAQYSDDNDPASKTSEVMIINDLEDPLEEDSDDDLPKISAIGVKSREFQIFSDSPRGSPMKGSASPRKYY